MKESHRPRLAAIGIGLSLLSPIHSRASEVDNTNSISSTNTTSEATITNESTITLRLAPEITSGSTMLPLRSVLENLENTVTALPNGDISIVDNQTMVSKLLVKQIDKTFKYNDIVIKPILKNGTNLFSFTNICQITGAEKYWNGSTQEPSIISKEKEKILKFKIGSNQLTVLKYSPENIQKLAEVPAIIRTEAQKALAKQALQVFGNGEVLTIDNLKNYVESGANGAVRVYQGEKPTDAEKALFVKYEKYSNKKVNVSLGNGLIYNATVDNRQSMINGVDLADKYITPYKTMEVSPVLDKNSNLKLSYYHNTSGRVLLEFNTSTKQYNWLESPKCVFTPEQSRQSIDNVLNTATTFKGKFTEKLPIMDSQGNFGFYQLIGGEMGSPVEKKDEIISSFKRLNEIDPTFITKMRTNYGSQIITKVYIPGEAQDYGSTYGFYGDSQNDNFNTKQNSLGVIMINEKYGELGDYRKVYIVGESFALYRSIQMTSRWITAPNSPSKYEGIAKCLDSFEFLEKCTGFKYHYSLSQINSESPIEYLINNGVYNSDSTPNIKDYGTMTIGESNSFISVNWGTIQVYYNTIYNLDGK